MKKISTETTSRVKTKNSTGNIARSPVVAVSDIFEMCILPQMQIKSFLFLP